MKNGTNAGALPALIGDVITYQKHYIDNLFADTWKTLAEHSINTIEDFAEYDRNRHLRDARRHASPAQKKALKERT